MIDRDEPVYVEPETARILQAAAEAGPVDRASLSPAEARAHMETASRIWNNPLPDMAETRDFAIEGAAGRIGMRLLRPRDRADHGVIVYFHGGGFVLGSLESHHRLMRMLAIESRTTLIGVDYRLAPEAPFPAALDDCLTAVRSIRRDAADFGLDGERLVLAGDSAGANLALACLLELRAAKDAMPRGGALFYGCYWARFDTGSHARHGSGDYRLSTREMVWFWDQYLGDSGRGNVLAEPLYADLAGLPPMFLNHGTVDPLADDTAELVKRLDRAGVICQCIVYPGLVHGFLQMTNRVAPAKEAMTDAGRAIRAMLR